MAMWVANGGSWLRRLAAVGLALVLAAPAAATDADWSYLVDKLVADGVERGRAVRTFRDPRVPEFSGLGFSLAPAESHAMYRGFLKAQSVARARACRSRLASYFQAAEARSNVPASVLGAILHVETQCGQNTGKSIVLHRLARLAMANEPENVRWNIARHTRGLSASRAATVAAQVRRRARYLEETFYPEVLAVFRLAAREGIDPLAIRGSGSGAFGLPQFLPSSFLRFAVDGNGDGQVSLFDPADAIASAANYLAGHGWRRGLTRTQQRQVIWAYNRSDAYIDTVLALAERLERALPSQLFLAER